MRRAAAAPVRALSGETAAARRKVTAMGLLRMKRLGEKICMVTAHDYPSAAHVGAAGVDDLIVASRELMDTSHMNNGVCYPNTQCTCPSLKTRFSPQLQF